MKWHLGMTGWQIGCLLGLAIGLVQAMSGNLEIASLPVEEGITRLAATMMGSAVLCAAAAGIFTATGDGEASREQ
jgi:hypothetical protein